jgi:hypothetical protein
VVAIDSLRTLRAWLAEHGIETDTWRQGEAKGVKNLWHELVVGESRLVDDPARRLVDIVQVIVHRERLKLVEVEQEFGDGRRRTRNLPPSDKIHPDEDYATAAVRCLREEVGIDEKDVTLVEGTYSRKQRMVDSRSYPGLPTRYTFHTVQALVKGLPDNDFWQENAAFDGQSDPIKRHRWAWRPVSEGSPQT